MKQLIVISIYVLSIFSCRQTIEKETTNYKYFDVAESDTLNDNVLYAITNDEFLEFGSKVAYVNEKGDTIIPFGKYAFFGTDTLAHFAKVLEHPNDTTYGRMLAINQEQKILFDLVLYDNGPDLFREEYIRVKRNGKMGFANKYGRIVIPCKYDYAGSFDEGKARVAFNATEYIDLDEHRRVESDEWFTIDKKGNKID